MCTWPALPDDAAAELDATTPNRPEEMHRDTRGVALPVNTARDLR